MRYWPACCLILLFVSCHSGTDNKADIRVRMSTDSQTLYISGLEYNILHDLKTDSLNTEAWQAILSVYRMPADTDMTDLQPQQPGIYTVTDTTIVFKPDTAFGKHQSYIARFYGGALVNNEFDVMRSKARLQGRHYRQWVFKF